MDMSRILQQMFNMFLRRSARRMLNQQMSRMGSKPAAPPETAEQKQQRRAAGEMRKKVNQAAKIARRMKF